jgi:hypothetical protein
MVGGGFVSSGGLQRTAAGDLGFSASISAISSGVSLGKWRMKCTRDQEPYADCAVPSPQPGMPVSRMPFSMFAKISPSERSCVAGSVMSGALGKRRWPIVVCPLPSFPWHEAQ